MIAEIRLLARLARELWRGRTAAAVVVIAGDDNLTETFGMTTGDATVEATEKILFTALRQLPRLGDRVHFAGNNVHFADAARHIAIGMAELWPRFPLPCLFVEIGPPAARVTVRIELDGEEAASATIGERRPGLADNLARMVRT